MKDIENDKTLKLFLYKRHLSQVTGLTSQFNLVRMGIVRVVLLFAFGLSGFCSHAQNHSHTASTPIDTVKRKSIAQEEHAQIGDTHITILYSAPAVRGRVIWGGLVPFDEVWVTGAHRATSFEIDREFTVGDKKIPAGKYAIFTIPGKEKWIVIFNKKWDQHLADEYDPKDDVARVEVTPVKLSFVQERLNYSVTELSEKEAILSISWETLKVGFVLKLN